MAYQQYYGATTSVAPHGSYVPQGTPGHRVSISAGSSGTPSGGGSGSGLLPAFDGASNGQSQSQGQGGMLPPATPMQQHQHQAGGMGMAPSQMPQGQGQGQSMDSSLASTVVYTTQYAGVNRASGDGAATRMLKTASSQAHGNVPVFEAMIRGIAVMMRRSDMWVVDSSIPPQILDTAFPAGGSTRPRYSRWPASPRRSGPRCWKRTLPKACTKRCRVDVSVLQGIDLSLR